MAKRRINTKILAQQLDFTELVSRDEPSILAFLKGDNDCEAISTSWRYFLTCLSRSDLFNLRDKQFYTYCYYSNNSWYSAYRYQQKKIISAQLLNDFNARIFYEQDDIDAI
jgi:hypothetical protein